MINFICGLLIGGFVGTVVMACCNAASKGGINNDRNRNADALASESGKTED